MIASEVVAGRGILLLAVKYVCRQVLGGVCGGGFMAGNTRYPRLESPLDLYISQISKLLAEDDLNQQ